MQAFGQLKTLQLRAWRSFSLSINALDFDISCVLGLRRLHIEGWSPRSIRVATGCQVYAKWPRTDESAAEWLRSPCWRSPGFHLASLHVEDECTQAFGPDEVNAIQTILESMMG